MIRKRALNTVFYFFILLWAAVSLFPFYWLTVMATRTSAEFFRYPPVMVPGNMLWQNAQALMSVIDFPRAISNTFTVAVIKTAAELFFCSMTAFYFAKFTFPGRNILFSFMLMTMMIPTQLLMIPQLILMSKLGWISTLKALIIPSLIPAFGIFWMTQFCQGAIHDDLINAGRIDGCGTFRLFWSIGFPIMVPGLAFLAIHTFMTVWNDFLWPLIVTNTRLMRVLPIGIYWLRVEEGTINWGVVMSGTLFVVVPVVIVFLYAQRYIVDGIAAGAVKG